MHLHKHYISLRENVYNIDKKIAIAYDPIIQQELPFSSVLIHTMNVMEPPHVIRVAVL